MYRSLVGICLRTTARTKPFIRIPSRLLCTQNNGANNGNVVAQHVVQPPSAGLEIKDGPRLDEAKSNHGLAKEKVEDTPCSDKYVDITSLQPSEDTEPNTFNTSKKLPLSSPATPEVDQPLHAVGGNNVNGSSSSVLPAAVEKWTIEQVKKWAESIEGVRSVDAAVLEQQVIAGKALLTLTKDDLMKIGLPLGPAANLSVAIAALKKSKDHAANTQKAQQLWTAIQQGEKVGYKVEKLSFSDGMGSISYIKLNDGVNWLLEESTYLFERKCDKDLHELLANKIANAEKAGLAKQGAVVTGNPGIGKSWLHMYLIFRFGKEKRTIVYHHAKDNQVWFFRPDQPVMHFKATKEDWPKDVVNALDDPRTIYLFDPAGRGEDSLDNFRAFTVVASSPDPKNYKEFQKRVITEYKMPCWSWEEVEAVIPFFTTLSRDVVFARFQIFGGIPRYLASDDETIEIKFQAAIQGCDLDKLFTNLANPEALYDQSHKIFHYKVQPPNYQRYTLDFASPYVRGQLLERLMTHESALLKAIGLSTRYHSVFSGLRWQLFEISMSRDIISKGLSPFRMRDLETGQPATLPFPCVPLVNRVFTSLANTTLEPSVYYRPTKWNQGAIDGILCFGDCAYAFQATINSEHPINQTKLKEVIKAAGVEESKFYLIFVVPRARFESWKLQKIEDPPKKNATAAPSSPDNATTAPLSPNNATAALPFPHDVITNLKQTSKKKNPSLSTVAPSPPPHVKQYVLELPWAAGTALEEPYLDQSPQLPPPQ